MRYANYYVLAEMLSALETIPADEFERIARIPPGDEAGMRDVIRMRRSGLPSPDEGIAGKV